MMGVEGRRGVEEGIILGDSYIRPRAVVQDV